MNIIKWELLESYKAQAEQARKVAERFRDKQEKQAEEIARLSLVYEQLLKREAFEGLDLTDEKRAARQAVEDAQKELEIIREENVKASNYIRQATEGERITARDLVNDFNSVYLPTVREEQLKPIQDRLEAARSEYLNAIVDYYEFKASYKMEYTDLREGVLRGVKNERGEGISMGTFTTLSDLKQINNGELNNASIRMLPSDVERKVIKTTKGGRK